MVVKEISAEARTRAKQLAKEIELKLAIRCDGLRVDPSAEEGVGTLYKERLEFIFKMDHVAETRSVPEDFVLPQGTWVPVCEDPKSSYVLTREDGQLVVKKGRHLVMEASAVPRPAWYGKKTSEGMDMRLVTHSYGTDEMGFNFSDICYYGKYGGLCHYCNINWTTGHLRHLRAEQDRKLAALKEVVLEGFKEKRLRHFTIVGGMLPEDQELEAILRSLRAVKGALQIEDAKRLPIRVNHTAPTRRETLAMLCKEGVRGVQYNLEIWHPDYFRAICPGKDHRPGRDGWIQALKWAVEIFGKGAVVSNFVAGLEPMQYTLEGFEYLCSVGVVPKYNPVLCAPGSKFWRHRPPTVDWFLELNAKAVDMFFRYGLVDDSTLQNARVAGSCPQCQSVPLMDEIRRRKLLQDPNWTYPELPPLSALL